MKDSWVSTAAILVTMLISATIIAVVSEVIHYKEKTSARAEITVDYSYIRPIAYTNTVTMLQYRRNVKLDNVTNNLVYMTYDITNCPAVITHIVTYVRGTNALFDLYTREVLPSPPSPWVNSMIQFNNYTWIERHK